MYNTKADDLARIANDLHQLARKYSDGSQHLDQQIGGLDGTMQRLIMGGPEHWLGVSSDAFQGAWDERRTRLQQASTLLSQSAQHFTQFAQTIEDNLPTIRADEAVQQSPGYRVLGRYDQQSISDEESQAQNAIITALSALNSQLEALAEEVKDCPQEREENSPSNINKSNKDAGLGDSSQGSPEDGGPNALPPTATEEDVKNLIGDTNKDFPLSAINANKALDGPAGTHAEVAGSGGEGADVRFVSDSNNQVVLRREVKSIQGQAQGSFNREVSKAAQQAQYKGEIFVQMRDGTDGARAVARFRGSRSLADLAKYKDVRITIVSEAGNVLFDGPLAP